MTVTELQALVLKLQSQINQLELTNKGANKALEFRLEAVLQANLDTFWLLICAILVFLMQAGFMCLESGLSRAKSSINVALKNVTDFGISVATFWAFGFALMYGTRLKFFSYVIITFITSGIIYPIVGHWVWSLNFSNPDVKTGWLGKLGFIDFAGSSVVHSVGGWVALAVLLIIGNRTGRFQEGKKRTFQGSNTPLAALGALILWFGWFGFNGGANGAMDLRIPLILINTFLAASAGLVLSSIMGIYVMKKPEPMFMITGPIAGLVSITASCAYVEPTEAIIIGSIGGLVSGSGILLLEKIKVDDVVSAVPVHLFAGTWATIAVAIFGDLEAMGIERSMADQLYIQLIGIVSVGAFCFLSAFTIFFIINLLFRLRVNKVEEDMGLNISEHNASTATHELLQVLNKQQETDDFSLRAPQDPFTEAGVIASQYNNIMDKLEQSENQKNIWKNRVSKEIKLAIDVQKRLMPRRTINNFPIEGINIPAREISGDFYDFYQHNDQIYFTLCDVSGKGVNAGMVMARAITLFKIYSKNKFKPNEIHYEMNNDLQQTNPKGVYVTSIVGSYNSKTDVVELSNAGHLPALFKNGNGFHEYESSSLPLGVKKADNSNVYKLESFQLGSGRLYCFTDGFSECRNEKGEEIGIDGVKQLITTFQNTSLKKELLKITKDVEKKSTKGQNFDQSNNQANILEDDLTIIGLGK